MINDARIRAHRRGASTVRAVRAVLPDEGGAVTRLHPDDIIALARALASELRSGATSPVGIAAPVEGDDRCDNLLPVYDWVLPPDVTDGGYIYFAQVRNSDGFIKIGRAKDLSRRRTNYRTSSPYTVEYLAFYFADEPGEHERFIHRRYAHLRVGGEWFRPAQDLCDFIIKLQQDQRTRIAGGRR